MDIYSVGVILLFIIAKFYKLRSTCLCLHNKYTIILFDSANDFLLGFFWGGVLTFRFIKNVAEIIRPKWQCKMDNPEKHAT